MRRLPNLVVPGHTWLHANRLECQCVPAPTGLPHTNDTPHPKWPGVGGIKAAGESVLPAVCQLKKKSISYPVGKEER